MKSISKKYQAWACALAVAPLFTASSAHAYYVAVQWDARYHPNVKCIQISKLSDSRGTETRGFGVNPKNGFLTTKYTISEKDTFTVALYEKRDCVFLGLSGSHFATFNLGKYPYTQADRGKKYVYARFLTQWHG